jgi:hypothetical protein
MRYLLKVSNVPISVMYWCSNSLFFQTEYLCTIYFHEIYVFLSLNNCYLPFIFIAFYRQSC